LEATWLVELPSLLGGPSTFGMYLRRERGRWKSRWSFSPELDNSSTIFAGLAMPGAANALKGAEHAPGR